MRVSLPPDRLTPFQRELLDLLPPVAEKLVIGQVRVDPPREILANKLSTLLSRSELRDLVDVRALERSGLSIETALVDAERKDASLTAGALFEVLTGLAIDEGTKLPGGVMPAEMTLWIDDFRKRLSRLAWPGPK